MFTKVLLTVSIIITGAIFACGNNLTGPEKELVGSWRFVGAAVGDLEFYDAPRIEMRFNSDSTWQDDHGGKGTWRIESNQLTISDDTGETERWTYFLDGNDLTFIFTKAQFLSYLRQSGDFTEEDNRILDQLLGPNDTVRLFFARKA